MSYITLLKKESLRVGMWANDSMIFITIEDLVPDDVIGRDIEIEFTLKELEDILKQAKEHQ